MIDLGMVDPWNQIGFEIDPAIYQTLKQAGLMLGFRRRSWRDASGNKSWSESGLGTAQLINPANRQRVGPLVHLHISCGAVGVPSRVGIVFFHRLIGCRVHWDLDQRTWKIEYP